MRIPSAIPLSSLAVLAVFGLVLAGSAQAADAPQPQPVADWLAQARRDCPAGFADNGAIQAADLTGDGRTGYIADPHRLSCAGSPRQFGGRDPAPIALFVADAAGNVARAAEIVALGYRIAPAAQGGAPTIIFETHDVKDAAGSFESYRWNGRAFAAVGRRSMAMPPID